MEGYRLFHGLPYDARLAVIAKRSGLTRAEVLALFIALHDGASQGAPRGTLSRFDAEEAALALDLDAAAVTAALEAFAEKGIIAGDEFIEWRRQIAPSTERVRRHRARKRASGELLRKRPVPLPDPDDPREAALRRQRLAMTRQTPPQQKDRP